MMLVAPQLLQEPIYSMKCSVSCLESNTFNQTCNHWKLQHPTQYLYVTFHNSQLSLLSCCVYVLEHCKVPICLSENKEKLAAWPGFARPPARGVLVVWYKVYPS